MNRRSFLKWISKLIAALPFVVLADLEPKPKSVEVWDVSPLTDTLDLWQKNQMLALRTMPWELEAPKEEVERLSKILIEVEDCITPWQRFLELNEDDFCYRSIPLPDSEIVEYNL